MTGPGPLRAAQLLAAAAAMLAAAALLSRRGHRPRPATPVLHLVRRDPIERQVLADMRDYPGDYRDELPRPPWARARRSRP